MKFAHVLVVGAGQMGGGIAQVVAASGRRVSLHDAAPGATERGLATMRRSLEKLAEKGGADPDEVLARVEPVDDLDSAGLRGADLLIEAVIEDADVKQDVFRRADELLPEGAKLGFAHPMGPPALADLIGLDTCVAIMEVLHDGLGDPKYAPCPLLRQYVQAGRLGRKSGRGFYAYG